MEQKDNLKELKAGKDGKTMAESRINEIIKTSLEKIKELAPEIAILEK